MLLSLIGSTLFSTAWAFDIPHESYTLPNGLSVILIEDHSIPQVVVDVWYGVGSSDDPKGASGFAHLFEHLMFMGTKRIGKGEFDRRMESYGGWNNASTANDYTNYYSVGPSELLDLFLFLEADRMVGLDITQEKLNLQRDVVRNERRQNYEDQPYGAIWLNLSEMMYPQGHSYHLEGIGSHEDLEAATLDTVENFYTNWYMPNNATLCVSGDFDATEIKGRIDTYFSPINAQPTPERVPVSIEDTPNVFEKTIYDQVQLPAVVLTWHSPPYLKSGDAELDILSAILSGSEDGRLNQKFIHEQKRVQEFETFQYSSQEGSLFIIMAFTRPDTDVKKLVHDIKTEVSAIANQNRPLSEQELSLSLKDIEMRWYQNLESNLDRAEQLQSLKYHTGSTDDFDLLLQRYQDLSIKSIEESIKKYLSPQKASVLYVLPKEKK
jgi:zinc protease